MLTEIRFTEVAAMLAEVEKYAKSFPGSKVSSEDCPMQRFLGFRVEPPEGEARVWVIGLSDLVRSWGELSEADREAIKTQEGRAEMAELLGRERVGRLQVALGEDLF